MSAGLCPTCLQVTSSPKTRLEKWHKKAGPIKGEFSLALAGHVISPPLCPTLNSFSFLLKSSKFWQRKEQICKVSRRFLPEARLRQLTPPTLNAQSRHQGPQE